MTFTLQSSAFSNGKPIPARFTGDGDDVSPPLQWDHAPAGTREFALICDDPDAPTPQPWVHWVLYKIPGDLRALPEGVAAGAGGNSSAGFTGRNSWPAGKTTGYRGPAPPRGHGVHHYRFRLYAVDVELPHQPHIDKGGLLKAMQDHVLAEAELVGTYER
ncbi:MAG: YbhB/YbcL family Raf kinase inhibitor-like protein [Planctomycetaceae bacterium]|nr:MAG: YbhB/YbcL family Raf kinase inhibitor-like protein [Planctomycetaceae bacterium]